MCKAEIPCPHTADTPGKVFYRVTSEGFKQDHNVRSLIWSLENIGISSQEALAGRAPKLIIHNLGYHTNILNGRIIEALIVSHHRTRISDTKRDRRYV